MPSSSEPRAIEVVITPDDWETWSGTVMGSFDLTVELVKQAVAEAPDAHPYLVFHLYELHPSTTPELPPDPEVERIEQFFREHPEAREKANWYAIDRDGNRIPFPQGPPE